MGGDLGPAEVVEAVKLVLTDEGMGPITLAAQYGKRDPKGDANNLTDITVGAIYSLSKRTNTYLGYASYKADANAVAIVPNKTMNALTLGLNHDF